MPRLQPLMGFLRLAMVPRVAVPCRSMMRFSTASSLRADAPPAPSNPKDAARAADLAAAEAATDADSGQPPAPKPVLPSNHTDSPVVPTQADAIVVPAGQTANISSNKAKASKLQAKSEKSAKELRTRFAPTPTTVELAPAKYHVGRSANNNYPVYTDRKRGGNLHLTTVRKITGDLSALRDELRVYLNKKNEDVNINALTQHVVVKGHHAPEIIKYLKSRGM